MHRICYRILLSVILTICFLHLDLEAQSNESKPQPPGEKSAPTTLSRLADSGSSDDYPDADYLILLDQTTNRVKESGVTEIEGYILYKLLTPAACRNFSVLELGYEPLSSFLRLEEVNILRAGKVLPVEISEVKDLPAPQSAIYWGSRLKMLPLPRLQVGDGIEVKTWRKGFTYALLNSDDPPDERYIPPMFGEYFDIVRFEEHVPLLEKRYVLYLPQSKRLQSQVYNGSLFSSTSYTADSTIYAWWTLNVPELKSERYQPGASDYATKVVMSTAESWEAKSRWFFQVNKNQFEVTPEIREMVESILDQAGVSKASEEKRAQVLLHWVAQNIRYSGQTMGQGEGYTLHPGPMIFKQRSGVCKDIAGMLVTMMRANGLKSYPAMTMAGSRIEDLPADQFNHCVVALQRDNREFVMYDPTWAPFNHDIWSKLETEQYYVVGTEQGEDLSQIPYSAPEESPLKVKSKITLDDQGNLSGVLEMTGEGAMDSRLRRMGSGSKRAEIKDYLTGVLSVIDDQIEALEFEHGDLYDFDHPMWWKIKYQIPGYALKIDGGYEFSSPAAKLCMHNRLLLRPGDYVWEEDREHDVFLYYTELLDCEEWIKIPRKQRLVLPKENEHVEEMYAAFTGQVSQDGRQLNVTHRLTIKRRQIPPEGYAGFRAAMNTATEFAEQVIRIERED